MDIRILLNNVVIILLIALLPLAIDKVVLLFNSDQITFLNIGQGDSILICNQFKKCGLIDTGKQNSVINKIKKYTSPPLEFLILTHPDLDHTGKTLEIIKEIGVKRIFVNESSKAREIIKSIQQVQVRAFELKSHNDFIFGNYKFDIFWPLPDTELDSLDSNETSISIVLHNQNHRFYLAGDLGTKLEEENQNRYSLNSITVAKLSHHGSKNSSSLSLLKSLAPDVAIFSVGKNSYGHPNIRVIEDLNALKIPFLRTDLDGDIQIKVKEQKLQIDTEKSKKSYIILN